MPLCGGAEKALEGGAMPLTVKICGLRTPQALDVALEFGADLVGFVFFPPSPRNLGLEAARVLGERVAGRAGKVALTVDATDETLLDICQRAETRHAAAARQARRPSASSKCARASACR